MFRYLFCTQEAMLIYPLISHAMLAISHALLGCPIRQALDISKTRPTHQGSTPAVGASTIHELPQGTLGALVVKGPYE